LFIIFHDFNITANISVIHETKILRIIAILLFLLTQPINGLIISKHFPPLCNNGTFNGTVVAVTALLTLQMSAK